MKKTVLWGRRFATALLITGGFSNLVTAQSTKPNAKTAAKESREVNVRIIERNGDQVQEIERTFRTDGLSDPERDKMVTRLVDSVKAARTNSGKRRMTIIVEDNDDRTTTRERTPSRNRSNDIYTWRHRNAQPGNDFGFNRNWEFEFRRGADSLADAMNRMRFSFPRDLDRRLARPFEDWSRSFNAGIKPSTIRGLDAYTNNPDRNQLTVRFTAPAKGDVRIVLTNPKGNEVARREVKNFSGEFIGQMDLGRNPQGTYFVTVTQNEDGAVKRVVVD